MICFILMYFTVTFIKVAFRFRHMRAFSIVSVTYTIEECGHMRETECSLKCDNFDFVFVFIQAPGVSFDWQLYFVINTFTLSYIKSFKIRIEILLDRFNISKISFHEFCFISVSLNSFRDELYKCG